jgi:hypothetical protein
VQSDARGVDHLLEIDEEDGPDGTAKNFNDVRRKHSVVRTRSRLRQVVAHDDGADPVDRDTDAAFTIGLTTLEHEHIATCLRRRPDAKVENRQGGAAEVEDTSQRWCHPREVSQPFEPHHFAN